MEMENLQTVVINNLTMGFKAETSLAGQLKMAAEQFQTLNLQQGQTLMLKVDGNLLQLSAPSGKTIDLPMEALSVDKVPQFKEPVVLEAKISSSQNNVVSLQITEINGKLPQTYIRQESMVQASQTPAVVKDIGGLKNIPLQNISLAETVSAEVEKLPLPPAQKAQLQNILRQVEVEVRFSEGQPLQDNTAAPQIMQKIAQAVTVLSDKVVSGAQDIPQTIERVAEELKMFIGDRLPAETAVTGLKTPLGVVQAEIPLPEQIRADIEIINIIFREPPQMSSQPQAVSARLEQIIQTLKTDNPQLYNQIAAKLPSGNENMLPNMVAFTKAALKGDIKQWLGSEVVHRLESQGQSGRTVLGELQTVLQSSSRQTPIWRIIEIPYYQENRLEQIKLAVKQYPDDEDNEENPRQKFGTRFVVDTKFTELGAFQFDGFSFAKDRRFDLIIRTERHIGDDLCANMMRIFKTTLNDVQYSGNIKINLKENFIKISENNNEDNFLTQGLFI